MKKYKILSFLFALVLIAASVNIGSAAPGDHHKAAKYELSKVSIEKVSAVISVPSLKFSAVDVGKSVEVNKSKVSKVICILPASSVDIIHPDNGRLKHYTPYQANLYSYRPDFSANKKAFLGHYNCNI